jgi:hypothetical protein
MIASGIELREHHLGRIFAQESAGSDIEVDVGALVRRLLLFEHCTIESNLLKEIPALVQVFGEEGLRDLIETGAVSLVVDAMTAGQIGQTDLEITRRRGGPLPLGSYRLASVGIPTEGEGRDQYVHHALQEVHNSPLPLKRVIKLKRFLVERLLTYPSQPANDGVADTRSEILSQRDTILDAIKFVIHRDTGLAVGAGTSFTAEDLGNDGDFRISVVLGGQLQLPDTTMHSLVEKAILAEAGINQRLRFMDSFNAVSGFQLEEYPFFENRIDFLLRQLSPDAQEERFDRVVAIAGLPEVGGISPTATLSVKKLLKLRESSECREFRAWLRTIDTETDKEIQERFDSLRGKVSALATGNAGRTVRFALTAGSAFVPLAGPVIAPLLSGTDEFVVDRLVGKPGPSVFLSKHYASLFKE